MKKRILSLVLAFAVAAALSLSTAAAAFAAEDTVFTVYTADVNEEGNVGKLTVLKEYSKEKFEKLAVSENTYGMYNKGGVWNIAKSDRYIKVDELIADAGYDKDFVKSMYAVTPDKAGTDIEVYSKVEYKKFLDNEGYFYGNTVSSSEKAVADGAVSVPLAVALTYNAEAMAEGVTAYDFAQAMDVKDGYAIICGSLNEDDVAGARFARGVNGIVIDVDENAVAKVQKTKITYLKNYKAKALKVKWNKAEKATGYQVAYSTSKKFTKSTTVTKRTTKLYYNASKLKKGKTYYVKVTPYTVIDGKRVYGKASSVKSVKIKK